MRTDQEKGQVVIRKLWREHLQIVTRLTLYADAVCSYHIPMSSKSRFLTNSVQYPSANCRLISVTRASIAACVRCRQKKRRCDQKLPVRVYPCLFYISTRASTAVRVDFGRMLRLCRDVGCASLPELSVMDTTLPPEDKYLEGRIITLLQLTH